MGAGASAGTRSPRLTRTWMPWAVQMHERCLGFAQPALLPPRIATTYIICCAHVYQGRPNAPCADDGHGIHLRNGVLSVGDALDKDWI